ncbi:MAG: hypothetical protein WCT14_21775 [Treponemataceae bacterium]
MNKRFLLFFPVAISAVFILASCQQFFTTSVAAPLARDPASLVPAVTSANAATLADEVANDPDASLAVLSGLEDLIAAAPASEQAALAALALDVASNASGVGGALLESADSIAGILTSGDFSDSTELFAAVNTAIAGLDNLSESASSLVSIFGSTSATVDEIAANSTADELAMAAIVLLAANASTHTGGVSGYVADLDGTGSGTISPSEQANADLAAALAQAAIDSGASGTLASILGMFNLTTTP